MTMQSARQARLLDFKSGGWVVLLAVVLTVAAVGLRLADSIRSRGARAIGDGKNVESYGFDLTACRVPREALVASGLPKDGIRSLDLPGVMRPAALDAAAKRTHRKLLVPSDRVIGVVVNGRARAYPIRIMAWHEVVNDTLGARSIAVTYSPLCDAAAVFDRAAVGAVLSFGVSGLLYNSNLVMYDRRERTGEESLWSQIGTCAIAGPAAGARLRILPASLVGWAEWRERHPETTLLAPDPAMAEEYSRDPYSSYFASDQLRFPVAPLPVNDTLDLKTPMVAVMAGERFHVFPIRSIGERAGRDGLLPLDLDGRKIVFRYTGDPPSVTAAAADTGSAPAVLYAFWFAWYAIQEGGGVSAR